jgi:Flp pilus assembly protein protease CpaA
MDCFGLAGAALVSGACALTDWRRRKIYNAATLPATALGLIVSAVEGRAEDALLGALLGFGLGFLGFAAGGMRGGDGKLMCALGAWLGMKPLVAVLALAAAFQALWLLAREPRRTARRLAALARGIWLWFFWRVSGAWRTWEPLERSGDGLPLGVFATLGVGALALLRAGGATWIG